MSAAYKFFSCFRSPPVIQGSPGGARCAYRVSPPCWPRAEVGSISVLGLRGLGGFLSLRCGSSSPQWLLLWTQALGLVAFSNCSAWVPWLRIPSWRSRARSLSQEGLVAPQNVGSPQIGDQTCVSCIGGWILYHWATREVQFHIFLQPFLFLFLLC